MREVEGRPGPLFRQALAVQLANPKAVAFFTAILAPFLDPRASWSIPGQVGVLALTTTFSEFPILVGCGALASRGSRLAARKVHAPAGSFHAHEPFLRLALEDTHGLRLGLAPHSDESDVARVLEGIEELTRER